MPKSDLFIIIGIAIIWLFITVNLNTILGLIYVAMIYFYWNKKQSGQVYPIYKEKNISRIIGISLIIAFIWIYIISGMVGSVAPAVELEKFQKMFAVADKPMHPYMTLFVMGLLVPFTEEMFFRGSITPYLEKKVGLKGIMLIIVSASLFSVWHLMAYQAENQSMISAFIFGALTTYLVKKYNHQLYGIAVHSILNTIIMASSLGLLAIM